MSKSELRLRQAVKQLLQLCQDLGIMVKLGRSYLQPKTRSKYLGTLIDSMETRAYPIDPRVSEVMEVTAQLWLNLLLPLVCGSRY